MKTQSLKVLLFSFVVILILSSCQKQQDSEINTTKEDEINSLSLSKGSTATMNSRVGEFELNVKALSSKQISDIAKKLEKRKTSSSANRLDVIDEVPIDDVPVTTDEEEIRIIMNPLVQNGRQIHSEIISKVQATTEWQLLTDYERSAILNITDDQAGELSLIYSTVDLNEWQSDPLDPMRIDLGTIRSCLSGALGLGDLYYLVVENPRALLSANGALKILKHVGLRYLGYVGLALAVWDFVDCVS